MVHGRESPQDRPWSHLIEKLAATCRGKPSQTQSKRQLRDEPFSQRKSNAVLDRGDV